MATIILQKSLQLWKYIFYISLKKSIKTNTKKSLFSSSLSLIAFFRVTTFCSNRFITLLKLTFNYYPIMNTFKQHMFHYSILLNVFSIFYPEFHRLGINVTHIHYPNCGNSIFKCFTVSPLNYAPCVSSFLVYSLMNLYFSSLPLQLSLSVYSI